MTFAFSIPAPSPGWTDARVDRLKVLYAEGLSCSQIAAEIGHVSRNSIIGKVHRLKLERRGANSNRLINSGSKPGPKPKAMRCEEVVPLNVSLFDLAHGQCKFPYGDGPAFVFCGHEALKDRSYCGPHMRLSTKPTRGLSA